MAPFLFVLVDRGTHQCALETRLSQLVVPLSEVLLRKDLLRALLGSLGAGLIDLLGPLPSTVILPWLIRLA